MSRHTHDKVARSVDGRPDADLLDAQATLPNGFAPLTSRTWNFATALAMIALEAFGHKGFVHLDDAADNIGSHAIKGIQNLVAHIEGSL